MEKNTEVLLDLLKVINSSNDIATILTKAIKTAETITSSEFGEIILTNNAWNFLEYKFATIQEIKLLETLRDQLNKKIAIFTNAKASLQIADEDDIYLCNSCSPKATEYKNKVVKNCISSLISFSSTSNPNKIIGALKLYNKINSLNFTDEDINFLKVFVEQISKAMEREIMRAKLHNFESRIVGIFDAISDPILVCNKYGLPIMANKAFTTTFIPQSSDSGTQLLSSLLPSLLSTQEDKGTFELVLLKPHAQIFNSSFVKTKDEEGNIQDIIFSFRDITTTKSTDQEFLHIVTYISRKIKSFFYKIIKTKPKDKRKKLLTYKFINLIQDFSNFTQLKAGPLRIQKFPVVLSDFLNALSEKLANYTTKEKLKFSFATNIPDECQFEIVLLDSEKFIKSLFSLIKFCKYNAGKNLNISVNVFHNQDYYVVEISAISNQWKHIPQKYLLDWQQVSRKFIENPQSQLTFTLSYIYNLIEAHKGHFTLDLKDDGKLACFTIYLPKGGM